MESKGTMAGKFKWEADKTMDLLDAVERWEVVVKETQPRIRGKWPWVAMQLFVPDKEWDLSRLSKRCERRVAYLRKNYDAYCLELILAREASVRSPSPQMKLDAQLLKKMVDVFGELKIPPKPSTQALVRSLNMTADVSKLKIVQANEAVTVEDDGDSEDEPAIGQGQGEDSSSSVGSNHSYHDSSVAVFSPTPTDSSGSSYYDTSSSDTRSINSHAIGSAQTTTEDTALNNQAYRSAHYSSSDFSVTLSKTSSQDGSSTSSESISKDSAIVAQDQMPAGASSARTSKNSSCSVPKTAASEANFRSLINDLRSVSLSPFPKALIPTVATAAGSVIPAAALPAEESDHSPPSKSSFISTECKTCSPCPSSAECCDSCNSTGASSSAATGYNGGPSSALAAGEPSEHRGSSSSGAQREVIVYGNELTVPQDLQQLPVSLAALTLNPSPKHDDNRPSVLLCDEDLEKFMYDDPHSKKTVSSKCSSKKHPHNRDSRNQRDSFPPSSTSSKLRYPSGSSGPEPSNPSSFLSTMASGNDDNVNVMVFIKLNNLKLSEAG